MTQLLRGVADRSAAVLICLDNMTVMRRPTVQRYNARPFVRTVVGVRFSANPASPWQLHLPNLDLEIVYLPYVALRFGSRSFVVLTN